MEKRQYNLCLAVLRRLNMAGVLQDVMLIGSWCLPFYREYFSAIKYSPLIRTRDIDFLVSSPEKIRVKADIPGILKTLGFVVGYKGAKGYIQFEHPDLIIEFLVPERGRGCDKPVSLSRLGINAVALRYLNFLSQNPMTVTVEDFTVRVPHPANFALHKLIVWQRRSKREKADKDREAAIMLLRSLLEKGDFAIVRSVFEAMLRPWQKTVMKGLQNAEDRDLVAALID